MGYEHLLFYHYTHPSDGSVGKYPIFLSILRRFDQKKQGQIILRESGIAYVILLVFLFFGAYVMRGLHISTSALSISGGIVLFIIAIRMIFPEKLSAKGEEEVEEPLVVPLAVPLTAGPSALAVLVLFSTRYPGNVLTMFAAVSIATIIFTIIMLCSRYLMNVLGKRGLIAVERLMGLVLTMISIQMFLSGITDYIAHLHQNF